MISTTMTIQEWVNIPDNPIQRNTKNRAKRASAGHLSISEETHSRVAMAIMPDGSKYKLDGHTRAYLWNEGILKPNFVQVKVDVYQADNIDEVKRLYTHFDNQAAVETSRDKVSGALLAVGFVAKTGWISEGYLTTALQIASGKVNIYEMVEMFINELKIIDGLDIPNNSNAVLSGMVAAMLITLKKRGEKIVPFWRDFLNDAGEKTKEFSCPVQALTDLVKLLRASRKMTGKQNQIILCSKAISAAEAYISKRKYTTGIKSTDISQYRNW